MNPPNRKCKYDNQADYIDPDSDTKWESSGLEITPLQPMHRWSLTYKGKMIAKRTGMSHNVDISVRSRFIHYSRFGFNYSISAKRPLSKPTVRSTSTLQATWTICA